MATAKRKQEVLDNQTDENSDVISDTEEEMAAKRQNLHQQRNDCLVYNMMLRMYVHKLNILINTQITHYNRGT